MAARKAAPKTPTKAVAKPKRKAGGKRKPREELKIEEDEFCAHYAIHRVGSDAVRHAFPDWQNKDVQAVAEKASKLLAMSKIQARVTFYEQRAARMAEKKFDITAERILEEFASIAFYKADDYFEWGMVEMPVLNKKGEAVVDENGKPYTELVPKLRIRDSKDLTPQQIKAVLAASMSISKTGDPVLEVKMADKVAALKALGQHKGLFKSIVEAQGKSGGPIQIVVSNAEANL